MSIMPRLDLVSCANEPKTPGDGRTVGDPPSLETGDARRGTFPGRKPDPGHPPGTGAA